MSFDDIDYTKEQLLSRSSMLDQVKDKYEALNLESNGDKSFRLITADPDGDITLSIKKENDVITSNKFMKFALEYHTSCMRCGKSTTLSLSTKKGHNNDLCDECEKELYEEYNDDFFTQPKEIEFKW